MSSLPVSEITPAHAQDLLLAGGTMIDVRTVVEFAEQHVPKSCNVPLEQLSQTHSTFDHEQKLILICQSGKRANRAASILSDRGFSRLFVVAGGLENWKSGGFPCEKSQRRVLPLMRQVQLIVGLLSLIGSVLALAIDPLFALLPAALGAGLTLAGSTGWCGLAILLSKMPWNQIQASAPSVANA